MLHKTIIKKIGANKGASISMGLFIFLVCAVVSTVVLVAGTAASGRMSEIVQMDQRYYNVTSAAKLLIKKIDKKSARVVKTVVDGRDPTYAYSYDDAYIKGFLDDNVLKQLQDKSWGGSGSSPTYYSIDVKKTDGALILKATAVQNIDNSGNITLDVYNGSQGDAVPRYTLQLIFNADLITDTDTYSYVDELGNTHSTVVTTTKIKWNLSSINTQ